MEMVLIMLLLLKSKITIKIELGRVRLFDADAGYAVAGKMDDDAYHYFGQVAIDLKCVSKMARWQPLAPCVWC